MSLRAIIIGLLGAAFIAGAGYINDMVIQLTPMVGNHLPIIVFGLLIVFVVLLNPALRLVWRGLPLRPGELAVIVSFMLVACCVPVSGLMRTFIPSLAFPAEFNQRDPGWRRNQILSYVPPRMLAANGRYVEDVVEPLHADNPEMGLADIPWDQWDTALATWMPIVYLLGLGGIFVAMIVHPQWSKRERLRYPVAQFARSLLQTEPDKPGMASILRNNLFWMGLLGVLAIHVVNGLAAWEISPVEIPLTTNLYALRSKYPWLGQMPGADRLFEVPIYLTVVGFTFFLASDVGFSLGISHIAHVLLFGILLQQGADLQNDYLTGGAPSWQYFGSYLALAVMVFYTGRRFYAVVVRNGLTFRRTGEAEGYSVWAFRGLLLVIGVLTVILTTWLDLPWPFALLFVLLTLVMFAVMARINAESGLFWCQPYWHPITVFLGLFGAAAMGPNAFLVIALLCGVLTIDPRETILPFIVNGLKISEDAKVRPARVGGAAAGVLALALLVGVPATFWASYHYHHPNFGWSAKMVPKMPFDAANRRIDTLKDTGELEASRNLTTTERLANMKVDWSGFATWAGIGAALALGCSVLRLRLTWWPIHPILFLVWGTIPLGFFYLSFLIGWVVKSAITRFGTAETYHRVKLLMVGVIAGDLLGGLVFMGVGAVYYALTGNQPEIYKIFPG